MRLILHIGTEKTGSTAIQQQLLADRAALVVRGAHLCESAGEGNHRALVAAFMPEDVHDDFLRAHNLVELRARSAWRSAFLDAFAAEVDAARAESDVFIVSSEHFHSRLLQTECVQRLADFLLPLFDSVDIVCYLRRQDEMALSFYSEKLRAGFVPPEILPLRNIRRLKGSLPPFFDFEALLARWAAAFGDHALRLRLYRRDSLTGGEVVRDFFEVAGLGEPVARLNAAANPSLCVAAQTALRLFNGMCDGNDVASRDRHRVTRLALVDYLQAQPGGDRGFLPDVAEARTFYAAFEASNTRVANRWFGREALFDEDFSGYPQEPPAADWEAAARLLAAFLAYRDREGATRDAVPTDADPVIPASASSFRKKPRQC